MKKNKHCIQYDPKWLSTRSWSVRLLECNNNKRSRKLTPTLISSSLWSKVRCVSAIWWSTEVYSFYLLYSAWNNFADWLQGAWILQSNCWHKRTVAAEHDNLLGWNSSECQRCSKTENVFCKSSWLLANLIKLPYKQMQQFSFWRINSFYFLAHM